MSMPMVPGTSRQMVPRMCLSRGRGAACDPQDLRSRRADRVVVGDGEHIVASMDNHARTARRWENEIGAAACFWRRPMWGRLSPLATTLCWNVRDAGGHVTVEEVCGPLGFQSPVLSICRAGAMPISAIGHGNYASGPHFSRVVTERAKRRVTA